MNNNYKIPNLNEGLDLLDVSGTDQQSSRMLKILQNLNSPINESADSAEPTEAKTAEVTCPICGATWASDVAMEDGAEQVCPVCDTILNPKSADPAGSAEAEPTITESEEIESEEEVELEESLKQYMECIDNGDTAGAKAILESAEATAICESTDNDVEIMLEKFVIKVNAEGKKTKVKVRTRKMKRTSAQKAALKKARKLANKGAAKKKRKKAMKARARMGLTESLRKTRTINAVQGLLESQGITLSSKALERAINEAYDLNEAEDLNTDKALKCLETVLNSQGAEIVDSEIEVIDGVIIAHITVKDCDADIYLGDIADEVAEALQEFDVDYDEPEEDDEDGLVDIDFYFVPVLANESVDCKSKKNESEDCDEVPEGEEESKISEKKNCNESVDVFESFAGGSDNIRCKINPAFIKAGQVIYDSDDHTVFTALTESVACDDGYSLAIEVQNSQNSKLSELAAGAEVNLANSGSYYLLKNNPIK